MRGSGSGSERKAKQSQIVENWKDEVDCDSNNVVAQLEEAREGQELRADIEYKQRVVEEVLREVGAPLLAAVVF